MMSTRPEPVRTGPPGPAGAERAAQVLAQLPPGTVDRFRAELARGLVAAGHVDPGAILSEAALEQRLLAPVLLDPDWPAPTPPFPVGSGAVHADLTDDDHETFARLRSSLSDDGPDAVDPEALAAAAQEWRLPVTPYRRPEPVWAGAMLGGAVRTERTAADRPEDRPGDSPVVIDLSALWAGPLATSLLAEQGAKVIKIDSDARPDGLRERSSVYQELNGDKSIIDLDLRTERDRKRFEGLLATADLVIDSFSRRVLPNLGYGPDRLAEQHPHLRSLSIVAFPVGCPEAEWISYGPGIHAICGLGHGPDGRPRPAPIAYPDALAGAAAFAAAAELLSGRRSARRVEISLAGAVAPLVPGVRRP